MKKILYLSLFLLFAQVVCAQKKSKGEVFLFCYFNGNGDGLHLASSPDGYAWTPLKNDSIFLKPGVGKDKLMRDPCILKGADNKFHMVWTVSWSEKGIGYASSKDLIHWSEQKYIPVMEHEKDARNCWAPEIAYDDKEKIYMIYWATTITGRFTETEVEAEGKYNHRLYYVTTKDFETFSEAKLLYEPGFNSIDATIIKENNEYIMFLKDETRTPPQKNIKIAKSDKLIGPYSPASPPITGKYWAEGPTVFKVGNEWIVYFDRYTEKRMGAVSSTDLKNWTDISDKVHFPKGVRHGTAFKVSKKEFERMK